MGTIRIVNYHYVRLIKKGRYPGIKGREVEEFEAQARYLRRHYNLIGIEELAACLVGGEVVPQNAAMMTFDDGYADHYNFVWPILVGLGIKGCFFIPVRAIAEKIMLEVNMIQLILAVADIDQVLAEIKAGVEGESRGQAEAWEYYYRKYAMRGRFDGPKVTMVKKMLQSGLPPEIRDSVIRKLWHQWVDRDEKEAAEEWYLKESQIREMQRTGMYFGNHSYRHEWLDAMDIGEQKKDINRAQEWLEGEVGVRGPRTFCYPFGRYDEATVKILKEEKYIAAFTTAGEIFQVEAGERYKIPRLDTNQIPMQAKEVSLKKSFVG